MAVTVTVKGTPATTVAGALSSSIAWEDVPQLRDSRPVMATVNTRRSPRTFRSHRTGHIVSRENLTKESSNPFRAMGTLVFLISSCERQRRSHEVSVEHLMQKTGKT